MDLVSTIDLMRDGDFKGRLAAEYQLMTMLQYRAALRDRMKSIGIDCGELDIMARGVEYGI